MLSCVILAGGEGKRFKGEKHKLLTKLKNKKVIDFVLENSLMIADDQIICITSSNTNGYIKNQFNSIDCVNQKIANGTGGAVKLAIKNLSDLNGSVLVLYGDMPLIKLKTLKNLLYQYNILQKPLLSYFRSRKKIDFGVIETHKNNVVKVVESKHSSKTRNKKEYLYNGGFFICEVKFLNNLIKKIKKEKKSNEYLLTDIFSLAFSENKPFKLYKVSRKEMYGVNSLNDLKKIEKFI